MSSPASTPPRVHALDFTCVVMLGLWVRLAVWPRVFLDGVLRPSDGDSAYHLRRLLVGRADFPAVHVFDPLLGWPAGGAHPWAPGFDWVGALLLRLTPDDPAALERVAALYPVLLGLFCLWWVVDLTRLLVGDGPGARAAIFSAGVLAALVPQFLGASRLGRIDHHVWETASLLWLARWVLPRFLEAEIRPRRFEAFGAAAVGFTLMGFSGGPLYVALVTPLLVLAVLRDPAPRLVGSGALALIVGAGATALAALGPIGEHHRAFAFGFPSMLQPLLVTAAAAVVGATALVAQRVKTVGGRLGALAGLGSALLLAVAAVAPLRRELVAGLVGWLAHRDPWLSSISEFQPLFATERAPLDAVTFYFGWAGVLAPVGLGVALVAGRAQRAALWAFAALLALCVALTLLQMRFGRVLGPWLGVALALGLAASVRRFPAPRATALVLGATFVLCAADPEVREALVWNEPRAPSPLDEAADALRLERAPDPAKADGVLASWEYGSAILSRAGRPVIASGFGDYVDPEGFALSASALARDETTCVNVMRQRHLGFVVTGAAQFLKQARDGHTLLRNAGPTGGVIDDAFSRAVPISVLAFGGSGLPGVAAHAERLMPVQASTDLVTHLAWALPVLWTYELVEGARVEGTASPGARIDGVLEGAVGEHPFAWHAWTVADAEGRWSLRLATPSGLRAPGVSSAERWRFGDAVAVVSEQDVREGRRVTAAAP